MVHGKHHEHDNGRKVPVNGGPNEPHVEPKVQPAAPEEAAAELDALVLAAALERARAESAEWQDKYVRLYAETENFRKRMARDF